MKILSKILKNRNLLIIIGIIILILLILIAGKKFGLTTSERILGVLIVLCLWVIMLMFERNQANRGAAQLEQSIKAQAAQQLMGVRPAKREEVEQLQQQLIAKIEDLKNSKLGGRRSGKAALYALPWYIFIGPPASGKTTAIVNSGLDFPGGTDRIRGVGGTRNCEWFFSTQAILLDTAGRYMTEDEDQEEWLGFLDILKKYRKRQPINGVIVGVSLAELAQANPEELLGHAANIRRRLDELIEKLGIKFPVYLVFLKCDLIQGFVEFFEDLNRLEREQIWGCTLTREQQHHLNPGVVFDSEFQELYRSLINLRITRLSSPSKREIRQKIFNYPEGIQSLREKLSQFVGKLFQPNPYKENPIFRGFYFSSGTQEGVPIDQVIQRIAQGFGLAPEMISAFDPEMETKSYFIKDLFTEVIIPDENLVSETSRTAKQKEFFRKVVLVAAAIVLTGFIIGVTRGFFKSQKHLNNVTNSAKMIQQVDWQRGDILEYFRRMEHFRQEIVRTEEQTSPILQFGMSEGNTVLDPAKRLYYKKSNEFIKRYVYDEFVRQLNNLGALNEEKAYSHLKAYLLMGDEKQRLITDEPLKDFLNKAFHSIINESFYQVMPATEIDSLRFLVDLQLEYYVNLLAQKDEIFKFENDQGLIRRVRNSIYKNPSIAGVYQSIKREAQEKPYLLSQVIGDGRILTSNHEIPGIFTKQGWDGYVKMEIEARSKNPNKEDWVLGATHVTLPASMQDPARMQQELEQLYYAEYVREWWSFLQSIQYQPFGDLADARNRLKSLADLTESPLVRLINSVSQETRFEGIVQSTVGGAPVVGQYLASSHSIDRNFIALHALTASETRNVILNQYSALSDLLQSMESDPGLKAKECAAQILQSGGSGDLPTILKQIQTPLPTFELIARKAIFEQPVFKAWETILGAAQTYLNSQWKQRGYDPFETTLADYYPFSARNQDAPLADFDNFFHPQSGVFWGFINEDLRPFIQPNSWRSNVWENRGIQFSANFIEFLKKADSFRKIFYQSGRFELPFSLKQDYPKRRQLQGELPVIEQIFLDIDGIEDYYGLGHPYQMDYTWPGNQGAAGATLQVFVQGGNNPTPKRYDGVWGWIKLLNEARIRPITTARFRLEWLFKYQNQYEVTVLYDLTAGGGFNNPFGNIRTSFNIRCPQGLNL